MLKFVCLFVCLFVCFIKCKFVLTDLNGMHNYETVHTRQCWSIPFLIASTDSPLSCQCQWTMLRNIHENNDLPGLSHFFGTGVVDVCDAMMAMKTYVSNSIICMLWQSYNYGHKQEVSMAEYNIEHLYMHTTTTTPSQTLTQAHIRTTKSYGPPVKNTVQIIKKYTPWSFQRLLNLCVCVCVCVCLILTRGTKHFKWLFPCLCFLLST